MRGSLSVLGMAAGLLGWLSWGAPAVQAQTGRAYYAYSASWSVYPASFSRYYYYSPYDSGYYTLSSPGYRAVYNVPNSSAYYRPDLPRHYASTVPEVPPIAPTYPTYPPSGAVQPSPGIPGSPGYPSPGSTEPSPSSNGNGRTYSPGASASPQSSFSRDYFPGPSSYSPENVDPSSPSAYSPPNNGVGNYPSSKDYYIPEVRRDSTPGPYYYYRSDLNRFYDDPRGYRANKLDIDREYFNPRSGHSFDPAYRSYYRFPGMSTFYTR